MRFKIIQIQLSDLHDPLRPFATQERTVVKSPSIIRLKAQNSPVILRSISNTSIATSMASSKWPWRNLNDFNSKFLYKVAKSHLTEVIQGANIKLELRDTNRQKGPCSGIPKMYFTLPYATLLQVNKAEELLSSFKFQPFNLQIKGGFQWPVQPFSHQ